MEAVAPEPPDRMGQGAEGDPAAFVTCSELSWDACLFSRAKEKSLVTT